MDILLSLIGVTGFGPDRESILRCFKNISTRYFRSGTVLLLLASSGSRGDAPRDWADDVIRFAIGSGTWSVHLSDENYKPPSFEYLHLRVDRQRAENTVVLLRTDGGDALEEMGKLAENKMWNSRGRVLVIARDAGRADILSKLWATKKVLNAVVMNATENGIRFVSRYPFSRDPASEVVNECRSGELTNDREMFNNNIPADLERYLVRIGVRYSEPYVLKPTSPGAYRDGVEIRIVDALREVLNFTVEYVESPKGENPFVAVTNGTPSGLFGLLHRGIADVIFLGMRGRFDRNVLADALTMHTEDRSVWIVPYSTLERKGMEGIFPAAVWIAVASSSVLLAIAFLLVNLHSDPADALPVSTCILLFVCNQLGYPPCVAVRRTRLRLLSVFAYLYSLHIISAYNSGLVEVLVSPPESHFLDSPEEAVDAGLVAYLFPSGRPAYNQTKHEMWNKILRPLSHVYTQDYARTLTVISEAKTGFTLMLENVAKYEVSKRRQRKKQMIHILDKAFGPYQVTFFMSRGHPLRDLFERKVQQLVEGGIVALWLGSFLTGYRKVKKRETSFGQGQAITVTDLKWLFIAVVLGWLLSFVVFVVEVLGVKISAGRLVRRNKSYTWTSSTRKARQWNSRLRGTKPNLTEIMAE